MTENYHYVWAILPFLLAVLSLKGYWKKVFKLPSREYPTENLKQFVFCAILFVVAVTIDRTIFDDFFAALPLDGIDPRIPRWLTYPALLTAYGAIQQIFFKRKEQAENEERSARQRRYNRRGY